MLSEKPWKLDGMVFVVAGIFIGLSFFAVIRALCERFGGKIWLDDNSLPNLVFGTLALHGTILVVAALFLRLREVPWGRAFGFSTPGIGRSIAFGILAAVVFLPAGLVLQYVSLVILDTLHVQAPDQQAVASIKHASSWVSQVYLSAFSVLIAPVAEEVLFRGVLYSGIKQSGFPRGALWATALAFAAIHGNLKIFLPMVFLGVALAWLYEKTNNLLTSIIAHATFNAANLLILYFGDNIQPVVNRLFHIKFRDVRAMNEFQLIERLTRALPGNAAVVTGAGDDCAVLDLGIPDRLLLFKTDAVVENTHFTAATPPEKIGRKALARCLSDIAAMAGTPVAALITLALPRGFDPARVEGIYEGLGELARRHEVAIAGGETTTSPDVLLISVSMIGTVARDRCLHRSGARVGDAIFVTGELGGSLAGKHLDFEPRLAEARWLAENFPIHSLIDLSDGLAGDLRHILKAGKVGAELLATAIPISRSAKLASKAESSVKTPLLAALTDGEDFELLFTLAGRHAVPLLDAWKQRFPQLKLGCIGKITSGEGISIRDKEGVRRLAAHGYTHFA